MKFNKTLVILAIISSIFLACSNDEDPVVINEEEVITTVSATLIPKNGGATINLKSVDLDGDGPNTPIVTVSGSLSSNTSYSGTLKILNETENPADNITLEILEEDEDHQFFFLFTNNIATTTYQDQDANGDPVGVQFDLLTGPAATGDFIITLRHQPNKGGNNVNNGEITNAGGETDVQVTFNLNIN